MALFYLFGIGMGLLMIAVAVFNWESWFVDHESRFIEMIGGESWVRWYWGLSGVGLIGVSIFYWLRAH